MHFKTSSITVGFLSFPDGYVIMSFRVAGVSHAQQSVHHRVRCLLTSALIKKGPKNMYDDYSERLYRRSPMASASVIFGVLSLILGAVFYLALPCGALAVLFAILSRTQRKLPGKSKAGLLLGTCGMLATVIITVSAMYYVLTTPAGRNYLEQYYRYYTGDQNFRLEDLGELFNFEGWDDSLSSDPAAPSGSPDLSVPVVQVPDGLGERMLCALPIRKEGEML